MIGPRLHAAIERLARAPAGVAARLNSPTEVNRISRFPMSWLPAPSPERLNQASLALAAWLRRRGPPPEPWVMNVAPLLIASSDTTFLNDPRFRDALADHLSNETQPYTLLRLIGTYFEADLASGSLIGPLIAKNVSRHADTAEYVRPAALGLFEAGALPQHIASRIINARGDVDAALQDFGQETSECTLPSVRRTLAAVPALLLQDVAAGRVSDLRILEASLEMLAKRGVFSSSTDRAKLATSLLLEFRETVPLSNVRNIRDAAVTLLGNPLEKPDAWNDVDLELQRLVTAWFPGETLALAFALTRDADRLALWKSKFWLGLVERGIIEEATFIATAPLMDRVKRHPLARFIASTEHSLYSTGILLMKARGLTVAEWIPTGSCRVWFEDNPAAPPMRQQHYDTWQTRTSVDYEQYHRGSQKGIWQRELLRTFARAGLNIPDDPELLIWREGANVKAG